MFLDKNIYLLIINGILKDREVKFIPCLLVIFIDTYTSHIINPSALFPSVQICGNGLLIRNGFLEFMEYDGLLDYSVICCVFNQAGCLLSIMLPSLPVYPPPSVQEATLHLLSNKLSAYHHTDMGHFLLLSPTVSSISYQIFTIPHSINNAALPVTNGAAIDVPVFEEYLPPGAALIMSTPGATNVGIYLPSVVFPLPENEAMLLVAAL